MCGIFACIGSKKAVELTLEGLKRLEYRGYDSAGIAGILNGELTVIKEKGKIADFETKVKASNLTMNMAIGHTRWATHGKPSFVNAHPQTDSAHNLAVVHNGIIENHDILRRTLREQGMEFTSETDTEVLAQLIASLYDGDILKAVQQALPMCKGSLAVAVVHRDHPDSILIAGRESPLAIGVGNGECFVASDTRAFMVHTQDVVFIENSEIAVIKADGYEIFDESSAQIYKSTEVMEGESADYSRGNFEHFMLKEIFEQPQIIRNALLSRFMEEYGIAHLEGIKLEVSELLSVDRILFLACGTSYHAACIGAYMIEGRARIPVQVEISSEFRYKNPIVSKDTLVIAISQSGETADTLAAVRELKSKGAKILSICNVQGSSLARESHGTLFLRAGVEVGVAATKTFTSQLVVISLFTLLMARIRHMSKAEGQDFLAALVRLPEQVQQLLDREEQIEAVAKKYARFQHFVFLGRQHMFPTSLEAALKLKEISYLHATAYPAGEMKHGAIALINEECPTIALCANQLTYEKLLSNLMEVKSRNGPILAIAPVNADQITEIADDVIWVPETIDDLAPILSTIVTQLFAYYVAKERGTEIDQPRNLAKSVTVE